MTRVSLNRSAFSVCLLFLTPPLLCGIFLPTIVQCNSSNSSFTPSSLHVTTTLTNLLYSSSNTSDPGPMESMAENELLSTENKTMFIIAGAVILFVIICVLICCCCIPHRNRVIGISYLNPATGRTCYVDPPEPPPVCVCGAPPNEQDQENRTTQLPGTVPTGEEENDEEGKVKTREGVAGEPQSYSYKLPTFHRVHPDRINHISSSDPQHQLERSAPTSKPPLSPYPFGDNVAMSSSSTASTGAVRGHGTKTHSSDAARANVSPPPPPLVSERACRHNGAPPTGFSSSSKKIQSDSSPLRKEDSKKEGDVSPEDGPLQIQSSQNEEQGEAGAQRLLEEKKEAGELEPTKFVSQHKTPQGLFDCHLQQGRGGPETELTASSSFNHLDLTPESDIEQGVMRLPQIYSLLCKTEIALSRSSLEWFLFLWAIGGEQGGVLRREAFLSACENNKDELLEVEEERCYSGESAEEGKRLRFVMTHASTQKFIQNLKKRMYHHHPEQLQEEEKVDGERRTENEEEFQTFYEWCFYFLLQPQNVEERSSSRRYLLEQQPQSPTSSPFKKNKDVPWLHIDDAFSHLHTLLTHAPRQQFPALELLKYLGYLEEEEDLSTDEEIEKENGEKMKKKKKASLEIPPTHLTIERWSQLLLFVMEVSEDLQNFEEVLQGSSSPWTEWDLVLINFVKKRRESALLSTS